MSTRILLSTAVALFFATVGSAQRPLFQPDDFVDPATREGTVFMSRIVFGGVWNLTDRYRPLNDDAGVVVITNSLYAGRFQFDYKHTELPGSRKPPVVETCRDCEDPVISPTPSPEPDSPLVATPVERFDTLQLGFYRTASRGANRPPATLRYRLSWDRRDLDLTDSFGDRISGREQTFTAEADTHIPIGGSGLWGTLFFARTTRSGTEDDRTQNEIIYVARPPGWSAGNLLMRANLAAGGITGTEGNGLNLVNPSLEAYWRHPGTKVNVHVVWSPQFTRTIEGKGWQAQHQVAVFIDRVLYLKMFGSR